MFAGNQGVLEQRGESLSGRSPCRCSVCRCPFCASSSLPRHRRLGTGRRLARVGLATAHPLIQPGTDPMAVVVSVCRHVRQSPLQGPVWLSRGITLLPVLPAMHGYCHQDHKPPTIQISCTAFWQVGKATNSPTQLNLAHALRLLLWAAASKAEWHSPASKLLGQIIPGKSLASPCHQDMPTHTCTSSRQ